MKTINCKNCAANEFEIINHSIKKCKYCGTEYEIENSSFLHEIIQQAKDVKRSALFRARNTIYNRNKILLDKRIEEIELSNLSWDDTQKAICNFIIQQI